MQRISSYLDRKFKTDSRYLFSGGFWLILGHFFTMSAILATSYFFANYLDEQTYGNYKYLITVGTMLTAFSLTGLSSAVTQAVAKGLFHYFKIAKHLSFKYGLIVSLIALIGSGYYYYKENITLAAGLLLIAILQPIFNTSSLATSFLIGQQKFKENTYAHFLRTFLTSLSIVLSIIFSGKILVILVAYFLSNIISNYLCYLFIKIPESKANEEEESRFTTYAKHLSLQSVLTTLASQIDKILIFQNLGSLQLAMYAFATALPEQFKGINKAVEMLVIPRFSNHSKENIRSGILFKSFVYVVFLALAVIVYIAVAPFIFKILYPQYENAVLLSQIYALGILFGVGSLPYSALKTSQENKKLYIFNLVTSLFQVVSLFVLLPLYGLLGAILARVAYRGFVCALSFYLYYKA
jgi:O-antigen/teichoic acid export membrane protein